MRVKARRFSPSGRERSPALAYPPEIVHVHGLMRPYPTSKNLLRLAVMRFF
ncbi:hypothetical protein ACVIGB_010075 [Bradyrhizobium sp. USDA 4341]